MNPNQRNDDAGTKSESTGAATGAALSDKELVEGERDRQTTQNVLSQTRADPSHTEDVTPGAFGPFRYWVNSQIRNRPEPIKIPHGEGDLWLVQELTMDGELRIANPAGDDFALVRLDERYCPTFMKQILGYE